MKLEKLDRRMKGHGDFKYKIAYRHMAERLKFIEARNWCWEQWGPSSEYVFWDATINPSWCWEINEWETKILLASDKEVQWYILKWG
jgi:hypothetical protein